MTSKEGWLQKESGPLKSFSKRWFRLKDGHLKYGKKEGAADEEIPLVNAVDIRSSTNKKPIVEIVTGTKVYALLADSDAERDSWLKALRAAKDEQTKAKVTASDFDLLALVGKGSFGKVMQVRKKDTNEIYAMKVLDKKHILDNQEVEHTLAEKAILQKVRHPFLVNLNWSFQTEDKLYFVLDFVNGGELFFHLQREKKFSEERVRFYAAEILLAIEHLHNNGIIYRDLKPENILLSDTGHICLTDFGLSKTNMKDNEKATTFCGTPEYLAPEVLKGKGYTKAVDWWSYGSLVYEMLSGLPPFYSTDVQEMYKKIMSEPLVFSASMSEDAQSLLKALLQRDLAQRLTDPVEIKKHKFFAKINWEDLYNKKITPPYIPDVKSKADTHLVDPVFLEEKPDLSPSDSSGIDKSEQSNFQDFTYVGENTQTS